MSGDLAINTVADEKIVETLPISMAYAPSIDDNVYLEIEVVKGTSLYEAIGQAGWFTAYPDLKQWCDLHKVDRKIDNKDWRVGVFSQKKPLDYQLQAYDRVEIYRPLLIDPMRKRKKRAGSQ